MWLDVLFGAGSLAAFVYFTSDLVVILRGASAVPPTIVRLARAGDRHIDKRGRPDALMTAGAAALFVLIPALWLVLRGAETDVAGQFVIAASLVASLIWVLVLVTLRQRWDSSTQ